MAVEPLAADVFIKINYIEFFTSNYRKGSQSTDLFLFAKFTTPPMEHPSFLGNAERRIRKIYKRSYEVLDVSGECRIGLEFVTEEAVMGKMYRVKEVLDLTGFTRKDLHNLHRKGIVDPVGFETRGENKLYDEGGLEKLIRISILKGIGIDNIEFYSGLAKGHEYPELVKLVNYKGGNEQ